MAIRWKDKLKAIITGTDRLPITPMDTEVDGYTTPEDIVDAGGALQESIFNTEKSYLENYSSSGRLWGGAITEGSGPGLVNIAAGAGLTKGDSSSLETVPTATNQGQGSERTLVTWGSTADLALAGVGYNLIYWDASAGALAVQLKENFYANFDFTTDFTIGRVYYDGTTVVARLCGMNVWNFARRVQMFGEERFPIERAVGMMISETGTRNIAITEGRLWAELVNPFSVNAFDSSGTDTFSYWYRDGIGGWTEVATQAQIDNLNYDDGTGTLGTIGVARYGVHWVYEVHDSSVHVVYGQDSYTLAEAEIAPVPTTLPGLVGAYATLVGKIIIGRNDATFTSIQSPFTETFTAGTVNTHNDLGGIQGGTTDEYYHITNAELTALQNIPVNADFDLSALGDVDNTEKANGKILKVGADGITHEYANESGGGGGGDSVNVETLTGDKTLVAGTDKTIQYLTTGAANRTITLSNTASEGDRFTIINNSAYTSPNYLIIVLGATNATDVYAQGRVEYVFNGTAWKPVTAGSADGTSGDYNISIGKSANGSDSATAIGRSSNGSGNGVAVGYTTNGSTKGTAIGYNANGSTFGAAIGQSANGSTFGTAAGVSAKGSNFGTAVGAGANGSNFGAAIGRNTDTSGSGTDNYAIALGAESDTERHGEFWIGGDTLGPNDFGRGSVQYYDILAGGATALEVFIRDTENARLTLQSSSIMTGTVEASMIDFTAGETASYRWEFTIQNIAGTTTMKVNNKTVLHEDDATWDMALEADDTNDSLKIIATGDATNAVEVQATVRYSEIRS